MKHKTLLNLVAASTLLLGSPAQSADQPKPQGRAGVSTIRFSAPISYFGRHLEPSKEQQTIWREIQGDQSKATREIYGNKDLTAQQKREQYQAAQKKLNKKLEEALTCDQKKNLAELKKQYTERTGQFNPNKWMDDIGMSKEQKEKWTTLTKNRGKAYNELYAKQKDITREERTAVYQELNKEYQAKFDAILTDEQKEKRAKRFRRPAGGQGGVGVVRNWYKELGLSDEQQKKMRILGAERGKKVRDIYANKELTRKEKAAAAGKAYKEYTEKLNAIYTPEQRKKLKERRGSGGIRVLPKRKQKDK